MDNFKQLNDSFGHSTGDNLLRLVAQTIKNSIRSVDLVGRLGGDEFAILLPETDYESAQTVLPKIHKKLLDSMKGSRWDITFSIGAVTFTIFPDNIDEIIGKTDNLMYSVKNSGKNMMKHEVLSK